MTPPVFHIGDLVVVVETGQRGTVTGRAGDWSKQDERDYYTVVVRGKRNVYHVSKLRPLEV